MSKFNLCWSCPSTINCCNPFYVNFENLLQSNLHVFTFELWQIYSSLILLRYHVLTVFGVNAVIVIESIIFNGSLKVESCLVHSWFVIQKFLADVYIIHCWQRECPWLIWIFFFSNFYNVSEHLHAHQMHNQLIKCNLSSWFIKCNTTSL